MPGNSVLSVGDIERMAAIVMPEEASDVNEESFVTLYDLVLMTTAEEAKAFFTALARCTKPKHREMAEFHLRVLATKGLNTPYCVHYV